MFSCGIQGIYENNAYMSLSEIMLQSLNKFCAMRLGPVLLRNVHVIIHVSKQKISNLASVPPINQKPC